MLDPDASALLARVLAETRAGRLAWVEDDDGYFRAELGDNSTPLLIRRLYFEAANQIGADPYFVEFSMTGWNARFAITNDSEGWRAINAILDAAFPNWELPDPKRALAILDLKLGKMDE